MTLLLIALFAGALWLMFLCARSVETRSARTVSIATLALMLREKLKEEERQAMEKESREKYMKAMAAAIALVVGPRDEDYNKGGITLRDYWKVNGIKSPIQMVDMKLKRAFSQIGTWDINLHGHLVPKNWQQIDKLEESMLDLINYAAFVICEAHSLGNEIPMVKQVERDFEMGGTMDSTILHLSLAQRIEEAVKLWRSR